MKTVNALIFAIAIVTAAVFFGNSYQNRSKERGIITVKGLAQKDFKSDLVVWTGSFRQESADIKESYSKIDKDRKIVNEYLIGKGIKPEEIVFSAVSSEILTSSQYTQEGKFIGTVRTGYAMNQTVTVSSNNVELVEKVAREITELLNEGVSFDSYSPAYYYTKLTELKQELIEEATKDAFSRAQIIVQNSNGKLGKLLNAQLGIFQITGLYEQEDYSWGGVFNTSSKNKTASVTVTLKYSLK